METLLASAQPPPADLARAYVDATCQALVAASALDATLESVHERASSAAKRLGTADDRLRVELEFATTLAFLRDPRRAASVLTAAVEKETRTDHVHAQALAYLARLALLRCDLDEARDWVARARSAARDGLARARAAAAAPQAEALAAYFIAQRIEVEGCTREIYARLGLPDRAAVALEDENRALEELRALGAATPDLVFAAERNRIDYAHSILDFEGATARMRALPPALVEAVPGAATSIHLRQGLVWMDESLVRDLDLGRARDELAAAAADANQPSVQRLHALLALTTLELRVHDPAAAQARLAEAHAVPDDGDRSCDALIESVSLAALDARVAMALRVPRAELQTRAQALDQACEAWIESLRSRRAVGSGGGPLYFSEARQGLDAAIDLALALGEGEQATERALAAVLRVQAAGSLSRMLAASVPTLAEIRAELLADGQGLLVFVQGDERSHLFALDRETLVHEYLPSWVAILPHAEELNHALSQRPSGERSPARDTEVAGAATRVLDDLIPPALRARVQAWSGLYVVGTDFLSVQSIESLPWRAAPLGLEVELGYLPSIPVGIALARRARDGARACDSDLVLLAAGSASAKVRERFPKAAGAIPFDEDSAREIENRYGTQRARVLHGASTTRAALLDSAGRHPHVLATLTHGVYDTEREAPACLVVTPADDDTLGLVGLDDILRMPQAPPYALLLACNAGRGPRRYGDDATAHLGGGFLARGAQCVVLSPGDVEYESMREVLTSFMDAVVGEGLSPGAALLRARQHIAARAATADPSYWARVNAYGLALRRAPASVARAEPAQGSATQTPSSPRWLLVVCICAALAIFVAALAWRARKRAARDVPAR